MLELQPTFRHAPKQYVKMNLRGCNRVVFEGFTFVRTVHVHEWTASPRCDQWTIVYLDSELFRHACDVHVLILVQFMHDLIRGAKAQILVILCTA